MNFRINHELKYTNECMYICISKQDEEKPSTLCEKLSSKFGIPLEELTPLFGKISASLENIWPNINLKEEDYNFLFKVPSDFNLPLGWVVLGEYVDSDLESILEKHKSLTPEEKHQAIVLSIVSFIDEKINTKEEVMHIDSSEKLFRFIQEQKISEETKFRLISVYFNHESLLSQLVGILLRVKQALMKELPSFSDEVKLFLSFIQHEFSKNAESFIENECSISIHDNAFLEVYPTIFQSNAITLQTISEVNSLILGLNFFTIKKLREKYNCDEDRVLEFIKALSDKSKLEILKALKSGKLYGGQLAERFKLTNATISYHMSFLVGLRLVYIEKENNRIYYIPNRQKIEQYLAGIRSMLL